MAHLTQSRPDSGLGVQVKVLEIVEGVPSLEQAAKGILAGGEGLEKHPDLHLLAFQMHAIVTAIVSGPRPL